MANVKRTVILTGGRAGQTCTLNHGRFRFTNGQLVLDGDGQKVAALMKILADQYQAFEVGSDELKAATDGERSIPAAEEGDLLGRVRSAGTGPSEAPAADGSGADGAEGDQGAERDHAEGDGHPDPRMDAILEALTKLDAGKDADWLKDGLPKVARIQRLTGIKDITRSEIERAAPNFQRGGLSDG